jgi:hypothetical protein
MHEQLNDNVIATFSGAVNVKKSVLDIGELGRVWAAFATEKECQHTTRKDVDPWKRSKNVTS